jgi:signal transduction histidine kinase
LIAGLLVSLLVLLGVCGAVLYLWVRAALYRDFDAALLAKARAIATLVTREDDGVLEFEFNPDLMPEFRGGEGAEYFELRNGEGTILERSPSLRGHDFPHASWSMKSDSAYQSAIMTMTLPDGRPGRVIFLQFYPRVEDGGGRSKISTDVQGSERHDPCMVAVARGTGEISRVLGVFLAAIGGIGLLLPLAIAVTAGLVVRRGLRPLERVAQEARSITPRTLSHRFPEEDLPAELVPICSRLNSLLGRLEEAFARERRFTADAAHELRTPIAELRSFAEVALMAPGDARALKNTVKECLEIALQMETLVTALLSLARLEAGIHTLTLEPIELGPIVREAWLSLEDRAQARNVSVDCELDSPAPIQGDKALVKIIIGNLVTNAVEYTPSGASIRCRVERRNGSARFVVENPAGLLRSDDLPLLFEPFWRKDAARADAGHSGLGLALVTAAVSLLNADMAARITPDGWFQIQVDF